MDVTIGVEQWLLVSFIILALLGCLAIVVLGQGSLALARDQATLHATIDTLRARLEAMPKEDAAAVPARRPDPDSLDAHEAGKSEAPSPRMRLLASVSHEFRTPLNGIIGMSELLLETAPTPEQASYIRTIRSSADGFLSLVEEILDYSAMEAGRLTLEASPVDLVQLVEGVAELLSPRAQDKGIEIATLVAADVPTHVLADRDRLRQILLNLVGNAVKFTDEGGIAVVVEREADGTIRFDVEDTGPGIAPERHAAIFREFEQGDGLTSGRREGTGLGLAITQRLVGAMGGRLSLDSEPGRGSTFHVRLDLAPAPQPERRRPPDCTGRRVLLLAPLGLAARTLLRRLEEAGAAVLAVDTVEAACTALAERSFDILIADLAMGEAVLREAADAASLAGVPRRIVMLSPYERRNVGERHALGYDAYLTKPVRTRSLLQQVAEAASGRAAAGRPAAAPEREPHRSFLRVLLAEDNDVNALIAMRALERIGATADWARNGEEALALATAALEGERPAYDVVLMDIRLPDLDGYEVARMIRRREADRGSDAPARIIALSANASAWDRHAAEAAGLDDFLSKPFSIQDFEDALWPAALAKAS